MSESLLEALMKLFALVANVEGLTDKSREAVRHFLEGELPTEEVEKYLLRYDNFIREFHFADAGEGKSRKQTARNSVKVLRICSQINQFLLYYQKLLILIRLIEYLSARSRTSLQEKEFLDVVADAFHIQPVEYQKATELVLAEQPAQISTHHLLLSGAEWEEQMGEQGLLFIHFEDAGAIFVKNFGEPDVFMGGIPLLPGGIYAFSRGAAIATDHRPPLYHGRVYRNFLSEELSSDISFVAEEISYVFKAGNVGLHPFNMSVGGGQLVAIMGGSGAGKSTLLNVLNGSSPPAAGRILLNGHDLYLEKRELRGLIGYVSQDDLLLEDLTVWQNLMFNARLCFADASLNTLEENVTHTLKSLGLWEAAHLKVGSPLEKFISGGQRKRLNIALELIREPPVLFIDEPTSGLSSRDSQMIMDLLKDLANRGKLIFVVIHQPGAEIFRLFDHLLLLDQGGYVVYQGKPLESISYFKNLVGLPNALGAYHFGDSARPEQLFTILQAESVNEYGLPTGIRRRGPKEWYVPYRENEKKPDADLPIAELPGGRLKVPNALRQIGIFLHRDWLSKISNRQYVLVNILEAPVLALIVGVFLRHSTEGEAYTYFYNGNIVAYLFISVVVALFLGLSLSAEEIIKDRRIRKRETFLHLNALSYLISKVIVLFGIAALQTALFALVGNSILGLSGNLFTHWWILFSAAALSVVLGLNISASFRHVVTVYILIPFILIPQILFSGVLVKYDALHPWFSSEWRVPWIGNIMPSRWFFEAMAVDRAINNAFDRQYNVVLTEQYRWDFYRNYWSPEMELLLQKATAPEDKSTSVRAARTMLYELKKLPKGILGKEEIGIVPENLEEIYKASAPIMRTLLLALNERFRKELNLAIDARDALTARLRNQYGEEAYTAFREKFSNKELLDFTNNTNTMHRVVWDGHRLVRKVNLPYFEGPHYYTPGRKFGDTLYPVVTYNLSIIWLVTIVLFVFLHAQILPRLINRRKMF